MSCLNEKITPHLALETLQQLRLETELAFRIVEKCPIIRLKKNGFGGKWFALHDVIWGREALTGGNELNVPRFFPCRNSCLYGELGAALFPEGVQPVTDGGQNRVMPPSVPSLVKCDWATIKDMA